jgi:pyridinium-3,5-biscarboxylic acid mononucleotide sulfurtransferase
MKPINRMEQRLYSGELEPDLVAKWMRLLDILSGMRSAAVAYSGGVDSALLAAAAYLALGERMAAFTVRSVVEPPGDSQAAAELAAQVGFRHHIVDFDDLAQPDFRANSPSAATSASWSG